MADWTTVAPIAEFPSGTVRTVVLAGVTVAVFNVDGRYYALEDCCSHEGEALSLGAVAGLEVICPRHQARFSLVSGEALAPPAYEPVASFPLRLEAGMVQVRDNRLDALSSV